MALKQFAYMICTVQDFRVTFVNGIWNGRIKIEDVPDSPGAALNSCPLIYEFLEEQGNNAWELVSATEKESRDEQGSVPLETLYLKKEKLSDL